MYALKALLPLLLLFIPSVANAILSQRAERELRQEMLVNRNTILNSRQGPRQYLNIIRGLLRSHKFLDEAGEIPCEVIQTLETDADAAERFITQIEHGQVPDLIANLPQEVVGTFSDLISIAASLPTEILDAAQAVVTDAENVFNDIEDGSIVSDLAKVPGIVVSDITAGWGGFTHVIVEGFNDFTSDVGCVFGNCPTHTTTTARRCGAAATGTSRQSRIYNSATATGTRGGAAYTSANASAPRLTSFLTGASFHSSPLTTHITPTSRNTVNSTTSAATNSAGAGVTPDQPSSAYGSGGFESLQTVTVIILGALGFCICWL